MATWGHQRPRGPKPQQDRETWGGRMGRGIPAPRSCPLRAGTRGYLRTGDLPAKQSALTCLLRALFSIYTKHLALQQSCSNTPAADGFPKANTTLGFGQRGGRRETRGKQRGTEASKQAHSIPCPYRSAMSSAQPKHHNVIVIRLCYSFPFHPHIKKTSRTPVPRAGQYGGDLLPDLV